MYMFLSIEGLIGMILISAYYFDIACSLITNGQFVLAAGAGMMCGMFVWIIYLCQMMYNKAKEGEEV